MFLPLERLYLELRYLSKGRSEFGKNDIFEKVQSGITCDFVIMQDKCRATQLSGLKGPEVSKK